MDRAPAHRPLRRDIILTLALKRYRQTLDGPLSGDGEALLCSAFLMIVGRDSQNMDEEFSVPAKCNLRFGHYEVASTADGRPVELGRGGMGITYKAVDTTLERVVALKVINPDTFSGDAARQRFLREARAAAQLEHPNIASVFHMGTEGTMQFYAMEFIEGETLGALVRREGPLPCGFALKICEQVTAALSAAHAAKLIHRDIKPANLMIVHESDGQPLVKVIDFGLVKTAASAGEGELTLTGGGIVGTPHFASPEQMSEKEIDIRSDIYSLGATLWHILTGRMLFPGSLAQVMMGHLHEAPPFDRLQAPPEMLDLLGKMLAKDPAARFQTPAELLAQIRIAAQTIDPAIICRLLPGGAGAEAKEEVAIPVSAGETMENSLLATVPAERKRVSPGARADTAGDRPAAATTPGGAAAIPAGKGRALAGIFLAIVLLGLGGGGAWLWKSGNLERLLNQGGAQQAVTAQAPTDPTISASPARPEKASPEAAREVIAEGPGKSSVTPAASAPGAATPLPAATQTPEQLLNAALQSVKELEDAGNLRGALRAAIRFVKDHPAYRGGPPMMDEILTRPKINLAMQHDWPAFADVVDEAAGLGSGRAMMLSASHVRAKDPAKAFQLYLHAAEKGIPQAMMEAGQMYLHGTGVTRDLGAAEKWFKNASDHGDATGTFALGACYLLGRGVDQDIPRGVKLLQDADEHDSGDAKNLLGKLYLHGQAGFPTNRLNAGDLFRKAKDANCPEAFYNLAYVDLTTPARSKVAASRATFLLQRGAELGNSFCMFYYAKCLEEGLGVSPSASQARAWYERAVPVLEKEAGEGSTAAEVCYAMCLEKGTGVGQNPRGAANLYGKAAAEGDPLAREWCTEHHVTFAAGTGTQPPGAVALLPNSVFKSTGSSREP